MQGETRLELQMSAVAIHRPGAVMDGAAAETKAEETDG